MTKQALLDVLATNGRIDERTAEHVIEIYRRAKVLTFNAHDGYQIKHGAFFDAETIQRAADVII